MDILEKVKLANALKKALDARNAESNLLKKVRLAREVQEIRKKLGLIGSVNDLDKTLDLPENPSRSDLGKAVSKWLKENVQGKIITASDGKKIKFNANNSVKHLTFDGRISEIAAYSIPYIVDVFKNGTALGRNESYKQRNDRFVAFHSYEKWVEIPKLNIKVLLEAKAGETENGQYETEADLIAYHQKVKEKTTEISLPGVEQTIQDSSQAMSSKISGLCGNTTVVLDDTQEENAFVVIKEVTDLDGVPIKIEELIT